MEGCTPHLALLGRYLAWHTEKGVTQSDHLPKPGDRFDRYEVLTRLAFGGMAAVYAVRRASIGGFDKLLAMKVMLPHLCATPDAVSMFLDEGRIAAQIEHPNVLHVFDVAEKDNVPFMIMEYVRGQSLANIAKAGDGVPMPLNIVASVLQKAAEGLHAAHEARDVGGRPLNVVHRDVSPQNLMVSYDGDVKVVDFGIAAARGRIATTRSGEIKGKLGYLAPESIDKSHPIDRRADIWALGVVAWEMLAGRRLFPRDDDATTLWSIMNDDIEPLGPLRDDLPDGLVRCVMSCLQRDVDQRAANCKEVANQLGAVVKELGGCSRESISEYIRARFSQEEAAEREHLARLMTSAAAPDDETAQQRTPAAEAISGRREEPTDVTAQRDISLRQPSKRASTVVVVAAAVVIAAAAATVALRGGETPPAASQERSAANAEAAQPDVDKAPPDVAPSVQPADSAGEATAPSSSAPTPAAPARTQPQARPPRAPKAKRAPRQPAKPRAEKIESPWD